jgi:hypothetical protein
MRLNQKAVGRIIYFGSILLAISISNLVFSQKKSAKADTTVARVNVTATATVNSSSSSPSGSPSSPDPFPIITADLTGAVIHSYLPFDIPFILSGTVSADIKSIRCNIYTLGNKKVECDSCLSKKIQCGDVLCIDQTCNCSKIIKQDETCKGCCFEKTLIVSQTGQLIRHSLKDTTLNVSFFINGLPPGEELQFEFVKCKQIKDLSKFQKEAQRVLDSLMSSKADSLGKAVELELLLDEDEPYKYPENEEDVSKMFIRRIDKIEAIKSRTRGKHDSLKARPVKIGHERELRDLQNAILRALNNNVCYVKDHGTLLELKRVIYNSSLIRISVASYEKSLDNSFQIISQIQAAQAATSENIRQLRNAVAAIISAGINRDSVKVGIFSRAISEILEAQSMNGSPRSILKKLKQVIEFKENAIELKMEKIILPCPNNSTKQLTPLQFRQIQQVLFQFLEKETTSSCLNFFREPCKELSKESQVTLKKDIAIVLSYKGAISPLNKLQKKLLKTLEDESKGYVVNLSKSSLAHLPTLDSLSDFEFNSAIYRAHDAIIELKREKFIKEMAKIRIQTKKLGIIGAQALKVKDTKTANAISKIAVSFDDTWDWIYLGYVSLQPDSMHSIPSVDFDVQQLRYDTLPIDSLLKYKSRMGVTFETMNRIRDFIVMNFYDNDSILALLPNLERASKQLAERKEFMNYLCGYYSKYWKRLMSFTKELTASVSTYATLTGSTSNNFTTRGSWYLAADFGICYAFQLKSAVPYFGTNIYFMPVDKEATYTLRNIKKIYSTDGIAAHWIWLKKRLSLSIGVTTSSVANTTKRTSDLFGSNSLMLGGGFRIGTALKISAGSLLFKGFESNPLGNTQSIKSALFVGASVDMDLLKFFGKVGDIIFPK